MLKRYALPCAGLVIAALMVAVVVHRLTPVTYSATCLMRFTLPPTVSSGSSYYVLNSSTASSEVDRAVRGQLFNEVSRSRGGSPADIAASTDVSAGSDNYYHVISVSDRDSSRATDLANAVCSQLVSDLIQQRRQESDAAVTRLRTQLVALVQEQATLRAGAGAGGGTSSDQIQANASAITKDEQLLAAATATPPDIIEVVRRASGASADSGPGLGRDLLIALVASVLACFLVVLIVELLRQRSGTIADGGESARRVF